MRRWDSRKGKYIDDPVFDAFIEDILKVYDQYGFALGHEDGQGAFIIEPDHQAHRDWLKDAYVSGSFEE